MPEPPQLAPFDVKEPWLYKLSSDVQTPTKETFVQHLHFFNLFRLYVICNMQDKFCKEVLFGILEMICERCNHFKKMFGAWSCVM